MWFTSSVLRCINSSLPASSPGSIASARADKKAASAHPIDVRVYLAALVSKPSEVDKRLDTLRGITVRLNEARTVSAQDKQTLQTLYNHLTEYLTTKEPLLNFTHESLKARLENHFGELPFKDT